MPRGERPLDDGDGPVLRFAADLRKLREKAGSPVYRELSRRAHYSTAVLSEAAGGRKLPSLSVTLAYVTACDGDVVQWERRWREVAAELTPVETPQPTRSPYLGAATFEIGDMDRFHGRDALVEELAAAVGEHRLVLVHGASGYGKSSLLRAGLAARRTAIVFTPGPHPIEECAVRLAVVAGWSAPRLRDELAADPANLHLRVRQIAADGELLLIVDQFEEVFTACVDESERRTFIAALTHAATADTSRCRVVLGVRADFLDRCVDELPDVHQFAMRAMTTDELREVVTKPALAAGLTVETALVARVIADANDRAGTLPLVSRALKETWHRRQGMALTLAGYDEAGGIRHAVARTAEAVYLGFEAAERDIMRQVFLRLTAFGDGAEDTKRRVDRCELDDGPQTEAVLAELIRSRLVTVGRHGIELAHEALLVTWPRLREWRSEDRDGLRTHRQLTEAAAAWVALDRDPGALYRGLRLLIAEDWIARARPVLSTRERIFFTASLYAEQDRHHFDRKRTRRLRQLVALLVVLLLVTVSVSIEAYVRGKEQFRDQAVQNVVTQIPAIMRSDHYLAGLLALAAYRLNPDSPSAAGQLLRFAAELHVLPHSDPTGVLPAVAVDSKADLAAVTDADGAVELAELTRGSSFGPMHHAAVPATGAPVDSIALAADGKLLAVSYGDGTLALWDVSNRNAPRRTWSQPGKRTVVSFSHDGRTLAAGGHAPGDIVADRLLAPIDPDTTLWDVSDPHSPHVVAKLPQAQGPVGFSADGHTVTTVPSEANSRQPQVWRQEGGRLTRLAAMAPDQGAGYDDESISDDGSLVSATAGDLQSRRTTVWQVRDGGLAKVSTVSTAPLSIPLAFDARTALAAGAEADHTGIVWAVDRPDNPTKRFELDALPDDLQSMFYTPDGELVTVADSSVGVWPESPDAAADTVCRQPRD